MPSENTKKMSTPVTGTQKRNQNPADNGKNNVHDEVSKFWCTSGALSNLGVSGVVGAAVGVASRRLTSDALYGAGLAIIGLQSLSYMGYIQINWRKVEQDVTNLMDQNNDGKIDNTDFKIMLKRFIKFAGNGLSDLAAFTGGFFLGAKFLA